MPAMPVFTLVVLNSVSNHLRVVLQGCFSECKCKVWEVMIWSIGTQYDKCSIVCVAPVSTLVISYVGNRRYALAC